jgi:hypothetical protein
MIYEDLYRQYEQNDVMHRGVCAVELAEKEVDGFLRSLSKELREQADELFGKLARAYEMQGFLFGGTVSGANWAGGSGPAVGHTVNTLDFHGSTPVPVYQVEVETGKILQLYPSANAAGRENGLSDSSIIKCCKGKLKTCGGYSWRYARN